MINKKYFKMNVTDVFYLQGNHTVFVGVVEQLEKFITKCEAQILLNNVVYATIIIAGEWMTERSPSNNKRAISTVESIDISQEIITQKKCTIQAFL
ncbi:MAG: hypothetical protein SW833_06260 [Cyanobacteriota bacterium]|nr:hypothetical protein [Cyanobacteriota bacterium]